MTRIAIIDRHRCNPGKCQDLCLKLCPVNRTGEECIVKGSDGKAQIDEALCTGCGICPKRCPFEAISIINLPEELEKEPIHRFGQNGFALYNLPTPLFGKVVGIIGRNGIGKSTAVQILAGMLKPNLGKDKDAEQAEVIEYFKGTEAQAFFEKLYAGEIKVSYKPQQVDLIPKHFKGTVKQLLEKADEKGEVDKIIELLELSKFLDTDISKISGGELQRVAIAATVLKKANIYFFDEPTSYLDIKQRLKVSKFIRSLADENTGVMVIEHDLIILDYMTDFVHLMYGKASCYGVVSQLKSSKAGINIYLSGYLKEENIRFRDKKINFLKSPHSTKGKKLVLTEWNDIDFEIGKFKLKIHKGDLDVHEVVGVVGENGIGKTTFVKILAGEYDTEDKLKDMDVAYKPQYLEQNDELVMIFLKEAVSKYDTQLIRPLELKKILDRKLSELSGGELQRVAIAKSLSEDSHMVLMDEPSAYLDVEQRMVVSKVIKDFMVATGRSALIVDHDLLFIDYLSDRLVVFDGVPAEEGIVNGPFTMEKGMHDFLDDLEITMRRDPENNRPRVNKQDSQLDREQKSKGKLYYG